jgi:hypothetical protein
MIVRIEKHSTRFVTIDRTALDDTRLSYKARGLWAYLMARPDTWTVRISQLAGASEEDGERAVRSAMAELQEQGYARLETQRNALGRMEGKAWVVFERPDLDTDMNKTAMSEATDAAVLRTTENADDGKTAPYQVMNKEEQIKERRSKGGGDGFYGSEPFMEPIPEPAMPPVERADLDGVPVPLDDSERQTIGARIMEEAEFLAGIAPAWAAETLHYRAFGSKPRGYEMGELARLHQKYPLPWIIAGYVGAGSAGRRRISSVEGFITVWVERMKGGQQQRGRQHTVTTTHRRPVKQDHPFYDAAHGRVILPPFVMDQTQAVIYAQSKGLDIASDFQPINHPALDEPLWHLNETYHKTLGLQEHDLNRYRSISRPVIQAYGGRR